MSICLGLKMKKIMIILVPTLLFIVQIILSFPSIYSYLSKLAKDLKLDQSIIQIAIGLILIILFIIHQCNSVLRPFNKFEKTKLKFLDKDSSDMIKEYESHGYQLRINVMLAKRSFLGHSEPKKKNKEKKKISFFPNKFKIIWTSENMRYHEDKELNLTTNQGVCGEAFKNKAIKMANLMIKNPEEYNLNREQLEKTKNLKFVLSCPIYEIDYMNLRFTNKVLGIVNFDGTSPGSEQLIMNQKDLEILTLKLKAFSEICSNLF